MPSTESKSTTSKLIEFFTSCLSNTDTDDSDDVSTRQLLSNGRRQTFSSSLSENKENNSSIKPSIILHGLPEELWLESTDFLNINDKLNLMRTNKEFNLLLMGDLANKLLLPEGEVRKKAVELITCFAEISNEVAFYFLDHFEECFSISELYEIAKQTREDVAYRIVTNNVLFQLSASANQLGDLGDRYPKVAKFIFNDPVLLEILSSNEHELGKIQRSVGSDEEMQEAVQPLPVLYRPALPYDSTSWVATTNMNFVEINNINSFNPTFTY